MKSISLVRFMAMTLLCANMALAQVARPIPFPPDSEQGRRAAGLPAAAPATPPQAPGAAAPKPAPATAAAAPQTQSAGVTVTPAGGFMLNNVSLLELIDILARRLQLNYILDPRVKGSVTVNTYGEVKPTDLWQLLETILRVNGAAIVKVGDLYRIVPVNTVSQLPMAPKMNGKDLPDDESMSLNLIFLKFVTVGEMAKLLQPFLGEGAQVTAYEPANLLIVSDNARNMRRTMELLAMFDSDALASQRVKLYDVTNGRPSDIVKELEQVFKAYSLSDKATAVKFLPVDRLSTVIAVASNPGVFERVGEWIKKLDTPIKATAGSVDNYIYRLKYGRAETVGMAIMMLYGGSPAMGGMGGMGMAGGMGSGMGGIGAGGGIGGGMFAAGMAGATNPNGSMYGQNPQMLPSGGGPGSTPQGGIAVPGSVPLGSSSDSTGNYLSGMAQNSQYKGPRIIPNPFDNTLLIQGTPQEWEQISRLLAQIDIAPRQVLIDAKIYEVDMKGGFAFGVEAYLQKKGATGKGTASFGHQLVGLSAGGSIGLTAGMMVGHSRELLAAVTATESSDRARIISAPSIIATDSIAASINVGNEVPTLSSQAVVGGVQSSGSSVFANTIQNRNTGVTLNVTARVNSSGVVTLIINQEVSAPIPAPVGVSVASTSFSKRNVQTQVTVQDGDTIAIGGIMQESTTSTQGGIPGLSRIPFVGGLFGARNTTREKTELIIFLTPRVIYDTNQIMDATEELKSRFKRLQKIMD